MSKSEPRAATEVAYQLIRKWEGFRAEPYLCSANVPTIGYGSTIYPDGSKVSMQDPEITEAQARQYLKYHVQTIIEPDLTALVGDIVNQNQYDALVSFCYNVGMGPKKWKKGMKEGFRQSTMLQKILVRDFKGAAEEFPKWRLSGGKVTAGLIVRRKEERELFERDPWA